MMPDKNCLKCHRLTEFRDSNKQSYPDFFNGPVPSFGNKDASLLVVGLAPGLKGANCTGRPFTGDYAGELLYQTLLEFGLAKGEYKASIDDGLELTRCRIANAVRCVPPQNKVVAAEINACSPYLIHEIESMQNLKVIVALGLVAHNAVLKVLGEKRAAHKFAHGAQHKLEGYVLADSYHCSRYNTNTGRLTEEMFKQVFFNIKSYI
ncbi:MAG: uracil-DNA glycosylase [Alphaproteobacteria bacterium]|nr:uracil-DNA glycosylase [Alphaproteobacteria bacterium]